MIKYAKVINEETKQCEAGIGTNSDYYKSIGMTELDVEQCDWNYQWYLTGYCPAKPEPTKEEKILQLKQKLNTIDEKSNRSMRAILSGIATEEDRTFLANMEQQAETLRQELKELGGLK